MGNALAYVALVLAVPLGMAAFFMLRPALAAIVVFLSFTMFLPEVTTLDAPGLPGIGKVEAASLACMLGLLLTARRRLREARFFRGPEALVLLLFVGAVVTVMNNGDALVYGPTELPGLGMNEIVSMIFSDLVWYAVPFFVGRALINSSRELKTLLTALAVAGAIYTPFLFIELLMSPQLHHWIYGFEQHSFVQTLRGGGYRPMVFMAHGLAVALFMSWSVMAAMALVKARRAVAGVPAPVLAVYNLGFLALCKSVGALLYSLTLAPLLMVLSPRGVARVAALVGILVLSYPASRAVGWFPVQTLVDAARSFSAERAQSLEYRMNMEELLSEHSAERPWFGWGRFGRNMVWDKYSGRSVSVSDGHWIIVYSIRGVVGFMGTFLLIAWPLLTLPRRVRRIEAAPDRAMLCGLALILAAATIDLIPNGLFTALTVFFAGALHGAGRGLAGSVVASQQAAAAAEGS